MPRSGSESADLSVAAKSILVVDDDRDILDTFNVLLSENGYTVETAETGEEAIEKSKEKKFDIALIDIKLPDMEGTKLLHGLKDQSGMRKIMITGGATLANAVDALNFGAHAYLLKPVLPDFLLRVIEEQLLKQQQQTSMAIDLISQFIQERETDFVSVVKKSLNSALGESATQSTIFHLEGEQALIDPKKFAKDLKARFGGVAETILKDILQKLESSRLAGERN